MIAARPQGWSGHRAALRMAYTSNTFDSSGAARDASEICNFANGTRLIPVADHYGESGHLGQDEGRQYL